MCESQQTIEILVPGRSISQQTLIPAIQVVINLSSSKLYLEVDAADVFFNEPQTTSAGRSLAEITLWRYRAPANPISLLW